MILTSVQLELIAVQDREGEWQMGLGLGFCLFRLVLAAPCIIENVVCSSFGWKFAYGIFLVTQFFLIIMFTRMIFEGNLCAEFICRMKDHERSNISC
jgi:hypothetical protein